MFIERKHVIAILILFVCIIAFGFVTRVANELKQAPGGSIAQKISTILQTDSSFFDNTKGNQSTSTAASPAKPANIVAPKPSSDGISADAYLVGNITTGKVYLQRGSSDVHPIASMSKLVTALAATDSISPDAKITITPEEAGLPGDVSGIGAGETFTLKEILYPLLIASSNIAAEAIASSTNLAKFVELMNGYAWEVGMPQSYFADPSGLSPHNAASAQGFFALARYLYKSRQDILYITRTPHVTISTTTDHKGHDFSSTHPFVNDPRFLGGKTGRTPEAGETMLTIMNLNSQPVAIIVLGSDYDGRAKDTETLIDRVAPLIR